MRVIKLSGCLGLNVRDFPLKVFLLIGPLSFTCDMCGVSAHDISSVLHKWDTEQACRFYVVETIVIQLDTVSSIGTPTVLAVLGTSSDDFALRCGMVGP